MPLPRAVCLIAATGLYIATACSATAGGSANTVPLSDDMSAEQSSAIADSEATLAEYHAGFARFETCMTNAGWPLTAVKFVDETMLYEVTIPDGAVAEGADAVCYTRELGVIEALWRSTDSSY